MTPFPTTDAAPPGVGSLLRVSRRAMATTFEVALPALHPDGLAAAEAALDLVDEYEQLLTVYRESSEVARVNREASRHAVPVDPRLFSLLEVCGQLAAETGGAFDPATGGMVECWATARRAGRIPTGSELATARQNAGFGHVILDASRQTVKFLRPQLKLNFGAVGKGAALDAAGELLVRQWGVRSALLSAGGSSVLALGTPVTDSRGWLAAIRHPADDRETLGSVYLVHQALGTSAATYQYFEHEGRRYGHVLDPRTGLPAEMAKSASVVAPTAAEADAISTAAFVRGKPWLQAYCQDRPARAGVLLGSEAGAVPTVENLPGGRYQSPTRRIEWDFRFDD